MYTNRLIHETSPYLLQHAHNPVDWYPWGPEAFEKAAAEDKPVLVSIGYSACHWCHVMERESFEDPETAEIMNRFFINIKVDREERPDLDSLYMDAVQAISGSGGWPLNVFLTPDRKPFYGGTYFPPRPLYNRPSWRDVLMAVAKSYRERKDTVFSQAESLTEHIRAASGYGIDNHVPGGRLLSRDEMREMVSAALETADKEHGGFGRAPKFPQTFTIRMLLHYYYYTGEALARDHALLSLDKMIDGGINDQIGGGFARYSTDDRWLVPHFEKMLYDNALMVLALAEAFQATGAERYRRAIEATLGFVQRELRAPDGGYYAALDADSEGVEGKFYTWSMEEIRELLGAEAELFCRYYSVEPGGNWEGTNILHVALPVEELARDAGISGAELEALLERGRQKLLARRNGRVRPGTDDKVLLGWNALLNMAFSKAYMATGEEAWRQEALRHMHFLLEAFSAGEDGMLFHTYKEGMARIPAFLDDYAALITALFQLQEITGETRWLEKVKTLVKTVLDHFTEAETAYFYFTNDLQDDLIIRKRELYDSATPSGNALMAWNLFYGGLLFDEPAWRERAVAMCGGLTGVVKRFPGSFGYWAMLMMGLSEGVPEIAVTGHGSQTLLSGILQAFIPFRVLQSSTGEVPGYPLLSGRSFGDEAWAYLCKDYSCQRPVNEIDAFLKLLGENRAVPAV